MNLKGKRLLVLGGTNNAPDIRSFADKEQVVLVFAGQKFSEEILAIADETHICNILSRQELSDLVRSQSIDGIFVGGNEDIISCAIDVCETLKMPFYSSRLLWDTLMNKRTFKQACRKYGVPTMEDYAIDEHDLVGSSKRLPYPVVIKPVDNCGSAGVMKCDRAEDFEELYLFAKSKSRSGQVTVEEFNDGFEICVYYTFADGKVSISSMADKYVRGNANSFIPLSEIYAYPSQHLPLFLEKIDKNMRSMLLSLGIKNGITSMQGFYKDGTIKFFEMGYRLGGTAQYRYTEHINGVNSLHMMMAYALTGKMGNCDLSNDNAAFHKPCCTLTLMSKGGTVARIEGLEEAWKEPGVLHIENRYKVGDTIQASRTISQFHVRLYITANNEVEMKERINRLQTMIQAYDTNNEPMLITHFDTSKLSFGNNRFDDSNAYAGKRLLILGGTVASYDLVNLAKSMGMLTYVADDRETGAAKDIADHKVLISTTDIDRLAQFVRDNHIDGVFCSPSEFNIRNAIRLCEKTGLPFYATQEQWDLCNNKRRFKQYCRKNGLPYIAEHFYDGDDKSIVCSDCQFPVIVKPVDGSGSQGVSVCNSTAELNSAIDKALQYSRSGKIIIEKYLDNGGRLFSFRYLLNNGECYPYLLMDTYIADPINKEYLVSAFSYAPSEYAEEFMSQADAKVRATINDMGLKNGTVFAQTLPFNGEFYCHDMGYRLSGGITYHLSEALTGINDMKMMLRYAMGGPVCTPEEVARINPVPQGKVAGQLMIPLMAGTIASIEGMDGLKSNPAVLSYIQYYHEGDTIRQQDLGNLGQQFARIYILADNKENLVKQVNRIQDNISIKDTDGNEMFTLRFDTNRLYQ